MTRLTDFALSAVLCIPAAPLGALVALLVRIDSPGPAIFTHERVGLHGQLIRVRKFRTMYNGVSGSSITARADSRVTRSGRMLRRSKLDELPQLINVLEGTMSLVGPRPEVPKYVELWTDDQRATILSVRPGITDPASLELWNEELLLSGSDHERTYIEVIMPSKLAVYERYVHERTAMGDMKILTATICKFAHLGRKTRSSEPKGRLRRKDDLA